MADRVSIDDLAFAAQWLLAYEGASGSPVAGQPPEDDDEQQAALRRVSAWVQAEITRREQAAADRVAVSQVAAETGRTRSELQQRLRRARRQQGAG